MNGTLKAADEAPQDEMLDIDPSFREAAKLHGRAMFALVMHAGMARQAVEVLAKRGQGDQQALHAINVLATAFNHCSSALAKREGWTEEMMLACDRDIQLTFQGKLIVPKIIVAH